MMNVFNLLVLTWAYTVQGDSKFGPSLDKIESFCSFVKFWPIEVPFLFIFPTERTYITEHYWCNINTFIT